MARAERMQDLIDSTIRVIGREGLDRATTKAIATGANANEVYIYRIFEDKVDLFKKTFSYLDNELVREVESALLLLLDDRDDFYTRGKAFFNRLWRFFLENKDKSLCYIQYYYSPYFSKFSAEEHKERFAGVIEMCSAIFRPEAKVWMILNHIINVILDFSTKVYAGEIMDDEDSETHVYGLIYNSVKPYLLAGIK